jgi:sec-independent protein translocase protein TatA
MEDVPLSSTSRETAMPNLQGWEIILLLAVILLLFGAKRLPDAARGVGRSLRIFKSEVKAAQDDDGNSPPQQIQAAPGEVSSPAPNVAPPAVQQPQAQQTPPDSGSADR